MQPIALGPRISSSAAGFGILPHSQAHIPVAQRPRARATRRSSATRPRPFAATRMDRARCPCMAHSAVSTRPAEVSTRARLERPARLGTSACAQRPRREAPPAPRAPAHRRPGAHHRALRHIHVHREATRCLRRRARFAVECRSEKSSSPRSHWRGAARCAIITPGSSEGALIEQAKSGACWSRRRAVEIGAAARAIVSAATSQCATESGRHGGSERGWLPGRCRLQPKQSTAAAFHATARRGQRLTRSGGAEFLTSSKHVGSHLDRWSVV